MNTKAIKGLRHFARVPFDAQVQFYLQEDPLSVTLIDIALKGALVETAATVALAPGASCRLVLPLTDDDDPIEMAGRVVYQKDRRIGMECLSIDVSSLTQLRRLIELNTGAADMAEREISELFGNH